MIDLENIIAVASAATKGPWKVGEYGIDLQGHVCIDAPSHEALAQVVWKMDAEDASPRCEATAKFIATCNPETVLEMAREIERLRHALDHYAYGGSEYGKIACEALYIDAAMGVSDGKSV